MPLNDATLADPHKDNRTIGLVAWATLVRRHPGRSVDELLIHPTDAIALCREVNADLPTRRPYDEILRALVNARKHGSARGTARRPRSK